MYLEFRGEIGPELITLTYILKHRRASLGGIVCTDAMLDSVLHCLLL